MITDRDVWRAALDRADSGTAANRWRDGPLGHLKVQGLFFVGGVWLPAPRSYVTIWSHTSRREASHCGGRRSHVMSRKRTRTGKEYALVLAEYLARFQQVLPPITGEAPPMGISGVS